MIEKLIVLEDVDPVIFYGVNNANIQLIKALYPKLRIVARGNVIKVLGDEEEMCAFEENIIALEKHCAQYNSLKEEAIIDIIKGNTPQVEKNGNVIVFSVTGKPIIPRSDNQLKLVEDFNKNDTSGSSGSSGSSFCGSWISGTFLVMPWLVKIQVTSGAYALSVSIVPLTVTDLINPPARESPSLICKTA